MSERVKEKDPVKITLHELVQEGVGTLFFTIDPHHVDDGLMCVVYEIDWKTQRLEYALLNPVIGFNEQTGQFCAGCRRGSIRLGKNEGRDSSMPYYRVDYALDYYRYATRHVYLGLFTDDRYPRPPT